MFMSGSKHLINQMIHTPHIPYSLQQDAIRVRGATNFETIANCDIVFSHNQFIEI